MRERALIFGNRMGYRRGFLHCIDVRTSVNIRTVRKQNLHHIVMLLRDCPHQRCLTTCLIAAFLRWIERTGKGLLTCRPRVRVGARGKQHLHHLRISRAGCSHDKRFAEQ